jgi:hypothetical protein
MEGGIVSILWRSPADIMPSTCASLEVCCLGVRIAVEWPGDTINTDTLLKCLPPASAVTARSATQASPLAAESTATLAAIFRLESSGHGLRLSQDGMFICETDCREELLLYFESATKLFIANHAPERVVVHAGVVAWNNRAILFPGSSHAGKSTLVAELLRCGAGYLSDDFAVLDRDGNVHPYDRPLLMRDEQGRRRRMSPTDFGARVHQQHLPIETIVFTHFDPGCQWQPTRITRGEATMKLLENTISVRRDPNTALQTFGRITNHANLLAGPRGIASQVARHLLI